jgi:hypothetical protein
MRWFRAAMLAASLASLVLHPAARAFAQAASPFPEVVTPAPARRPYGWAIASFAAGAGLIGASFRLSDLANQKYADYLRATDPARIAELYDDAVRYDRLSTTSLFGGESLIAVSLYVGFLRRADPPRLRFALQARRCALSLRF